MLKRGDVARQLDCHIETVRYYEGIGLIEPPQRTRGGHRIYDGDDVARLRFVLRLRDLGFPLEDVRALLATVKTGDYACADVAAIAEHQLTEIRRKIEDLRRLEQTLTRMTEQCHRGSTPDCAIIEALS